MTKRLFHILVAVVVVASVAVGGFSGAAVAQEETRAADLEIQQPHYIDDEVSVRQSNGSTVYEASGEHLRLYPTQFDADNVVEAGIEPSTAGFERTDAGAGYTLTVDETGTYDVYWVVERSVTDGNQTTTERIRYEASVRVGGPLGVASINQTELAELRDDADKWQHANATMHHQMDNSILISLTPGSPTAQEWLASSLSKQQLVHNPAAAFSGGLTMFFIGLFSLGGSLVGIVFLGWHAKAITFLRRRLNLHESVQNEEGELNKRFEQQERDRAASSVQNEQFSDVYLPHVADAMRELGETPLEADCNITANGLLPSVGLAYKARAMAQDNYVGALSLPDDDVRTDGGDAEDGDGDDLATDDVLAMARARDEELAIIDIDADTVPDDAVEVDLSKADRDWLDVLPTGGQTMLEYDILNRDIDREAIQVDGVDWTVEEIIARLQLEARHFESASEAATYFVDFLRDVREHPVTDTDGEPRTCRLVLETLLRDSQLLDDRFNISKQYGIDMLEAAIEADDPVEDGLGTVADIDEGKYA
jgi:hypothetical protein